VHGQLRLLRRQRRLHRPGRPLLGHRHGHRDRRLRLRLAADRHPGRGRRRQPALIRLNAADHGKVNPTVPIWGGPTALGASTVLRDKVYSYGNSSLRGGLEQLSPKEGYSLGDEGSGWTHTVYTATPGIPGDSGSAFLSKDGRALGTLSTVAIAPVTGSNGVGDVQREFDYARANGGFGGLKLGLGTEPFAAGNLP
jgi:hypothetical protein